MRVLIAPDKFAGTLTAVEAAQAIATGWARRAPQDSLDLVPMADGGPGFVDVLHASLGGDLLAVTVSGPYGDPVPGTVLLQDGPEPFIDAGDLGSELRRTSGQAAYGGHPGVRRIGSLDGPAGETVEHQRERPIPALRRYIGQ